MNSAPEMVNVHLAWHGIDIDETAKHVTEFLKKYVTEADGIRMLDYCDLHFKISKEHLEDVRKEFANNVIMVEIYDD